nr:L-tyrosine/L-tryptophan isonitrile synthase family protein [Streptomyces typhae]
MAHGRTIDFLLPAFPTKSPNPAKVLGPLPDLAEERALKFLDSLCARVTEVYPPGARIRICSDGRVFNDLIGVSDDDVTGYARALNRMIDRIGADHLDQFTLDDVYRGADPARMRAALTTDRGPHEDELRAEVRRGGDLVPMYRGITRFLLEDLSTPQYTGSRAALQSRSRALAYSVIARSRAWDELLGELFPDALRLSIHPQPCSTRKIGVLLADTPDVWLTPWHSVAVDTGGGHFTLMKRAEAEAAGARLVTAHGRPSHFVLPPPEAAATATGTAATPTPEPTPPSHPNPHPHRSRRPAMPVDHDLLGAHRLRSDALSPFGLALHAKDADRPLTDLPVAPLRALVHEHRLLLLRGFAGFADAGGLAAYAERWGEPALWPFGTVLDLVQQRDPADHIFGHSHMPMHWDGMYREHIPEFQIFQCVHAPGSDEGGETIFSDTVAVLADADPDSRALWSRATGTYHREMEYYDSTTRSPVVTAHPVHGTPVIRYHEPTAAAGDAFVNHPDLEFSGPTDEAELAELHRSLRAALYDPAHLYAHRWRTGDVLVTDNYTLLHGRNAFTSGAPRHLRRVQILGTPPLSNPGLVR